MRCSHMPTPLELQPLDSREKRALDAAFLLTLVASLAAPFATKDPAAIWWIDAAVVGGCYGFAYLLDEARFSTSARTCARLHAACA